ncbi:hypothetical protein L1887_54826 [Cichorium endivia]|nr:hypothetical protein L1887_54826 [Cichorium endivia]
MWSRNARRMQSGRARAAWTCSTDRRRCAQAATCRRCRHGRLRIGAIARVEQLHGCGPVGVVCGARRGRRKGRYGRHLGRQQRRIWAARCESRACRPEKRAARCGADRGIDGQIGVGAQSRARRPRPIVKVGRRGCCVRCIGGRVDRHTERQLGLGNERVGRASWCGCPCWAGRLPVSGRVVVLSAILVVVHVLFRPVLFSGAVLSRPVRPR